MKYTFNTTVPSIGSTLLHPFTCIKTPLYGYTSLIFYSIIRAGFKENEILHNPIIIGNVIINRSIPYLLINSNMIIVSFLRHLIYLKRSEERRVGNNLYRG